MKDKITTGIFIITVAIAITTVLALLSKWYLFILNL